MARFVLRYGARVDALDREFSLVNDPVLRLLRVLRICPPDGFAATRRALLLAGISWIPIIVWAALSGHLHPTVQDESLMRHLGVHVRCLIGIPLFILSEPFADRVMRVLVGNFTLSGLIRAEDRARFDDVVRSVERLRDSRLAWIAMRALVIVSAIVSRRTWLTEDADALVWSTNHAALDFGGSWAMLVVRPLFLFMLLQWLWRLILTWVLFRRISKLDLQLVPSHPDHVGGLGFIRLHSLAFSMVVFAISSVVCVAVAHQMLAHDATFAQYQVLLIFLTALLAVLFMLPLSAFQGVIRRTSVRAQFDYGTLSGRHVRALHARWVQGRSVEDDILSAPEIGPAADVATLYSMGTSMRMVPVGKFQIGALVVPALLPVLLVASVEVPITDILIRIIKTLS